MDCGTIEFLILDDARSLTPAAQEALRARVVKGMCEVQSQVEAAATLQVARGTVSRWLARQQGCIRRYFLPGYSSQPNPEELLNQDVKSNALGRRRPTDQEEVIDDVRGYLRSTQKQPEILKTCFSEPHVHYAAA